MKHIVLGDRVTGAEIRPPGMLARLRAQSIDDAQAFFGGSTHVETVPCPACGSPDASEAFRKHGFVYQECRRCESLYVSPRPTPDTLKRYYRQSEASRLRAEYFGKEVTVARLEHVVSSRVDWLCSLLPRKQAEGRHYVDVGTAYPQVFAEIRRLGYFGSLYAVDPPESLRPLLERDGVALGAPAPGSAAAVTAFEQLEHQGAPGAWLAHLSALLTEDGVMFLTTRSVSGFDLQVLWDAAPYIFVPEHLNLFSLCGLEILFERHQLELIELSTPGQLDVELVREAAEQDAEVELPRFARRLVLGGNAEAREDFQKFLQKYRLSSHVRIAARQTRGETDRLVDPKDSQ